MSWLTGYLYRRTITINHTKVGGSLSYFPIAVVITNDSIIGARALSTGYDIRFTSSDGTTLLNYERPMYSISGGVCNAIFWVQIPMLSSTVDVNIYLYYGKSDATDVANTTTTWNDGGNNNYIGVWHLGESGSGAPGDYKDSSPFGYNSINTTSQPSVTTGVIGNGQLFNGSTYIDFGNQTNLNLGTNNFTVSMQVNKSSNTTMGVISKGSSGNNIGYLIRFNSSSKPELIMSSTGTSNVDYIESNLSIANNQNLHLALVANRSTNAYFYVNAVKGTGASISSQSESISNTTSQRFGVYTTTYYSGMIDEVRISNIARSDAWLATEYANQNSISTFYTMSPEVQLNNKVPKIYQIGIEGSLTKFLQSYGMVID